MTQPGMQMPQQQMQQQPQRQGGLGGLVRGVISGAGEPFSYLLNSAIVNPTKELAATATGNKVALRNATKESNRELGLGDSGSDLTGGLKKWAGNSTQAALSLTGAPTTFKGAAALGGATGAASTLAQRDSNLEDVLTSGVLGAGTGAAFKGAGNLTGKLTSKAGKALDNQSTKLATKQFGLTSNYLAKFNKKFGEDAGKVLTKYGVSSIDDLEGQIAKQNSVFDSLVKSTGPVKKTDVENKLVKIADDLIKQAPTEQKLAGQKLLQETDQLLSQFGDTIDATELNQIKNQYASLVNYDAKVSNKNTYDLNRRVAGAIRETIQDASGNNALKNTGQELNKLINLAEEVDKRAPAVASRGASPLNLRNMIGMTAGGSLGGPAGALGGAIASSVANSPLGRRVATKATQGAANKLMQEGGSAVGGFLANRAVPGVVQALGGGPQQAGAAGLEDALMGDYSVNNAMTPMNNPMSAPASNDMNNPFLQEAYPNSQQMSSDNPFQQQQAQSSNPYSKEGLLSDIQRDPQNADKYIAYYQSLEDIFAPKQAEPLKLNNTAIQTITDLQTGLDNLDELGGRISSSSANNPVLGALRSKNPFDTEAKSLRAEIDRVKQVVGKALEGGVLRKEDEDKYKRILPTINDTDAVAAQKIAAIKSDLQNKLNTFYVNQNQFSGGPQDLSGLVTQQQGAYY